ncbi:polysaccharide deacetylase [Luteimonas aestuarii]|uniref:Polysaccharide deacetylase n=1 Tax=Luteimonas aestuarii TaxID=453837 RepID=A0A4R5TTN7_9GAMM|nr:polysaccharide deacetylase family protein [Luteimonas aestuarii]TDK24369.1 polysaccharide deacetylase [Luteimonas aestuarii]
MRMAVFGAVCALLAWSGLVHAAKPSFAWPNGAKAAVNLAYDDALDSQLDNAIPALDRHGFKGSFYLTLGAQVVRTRMEEWRAAARNGHELGNHSLFHQCSGRGAGREWVAPQQDLDRTTVAQMRDQVLLANTMLQAIDGSTEFTYTAPCGDRMAMDGDYLPSIADAFLGIKLVEGTGVADMAGFDPLAAPVVAPVEFTGAQLIALVEDAGRNGTMIGFTFHGIGGDHLQTSVEAHDELLAYLAAHRDVYWVDTFRNQMRWVRDQRATGGADTAATP